jgi:hypothetical protein
MRWPSCRFENPRSMKFCGQCATPLARCCPQRDFENPLIFAFDQCATSLTEISPAPPPRPVAPYLQEPRAYTQKHLAGRILTTRSALEEERYR